MAKVSDNPYFNSPFAHALRRHLTAHPEQSASDLARLLRVDRRTVYNWRDGKCMPRLDQAVRVADALGIDVHSITHHT